MIKHYLLVTIRNFKRNLLYSLINIIGLVLGIVSVIFVFAWIYDETSYDNFHPYVNQMYRVEALMPFEKPTLWSSTQAPLEESLKEDFSEILYSTKIKYYYNPIIELHNEPINESGFYLVTPEFFKIFGVNTISANPEKLISEPYKVLISESTSHKYFGDDNPIGKNIQVNQKFNYTVKGVFKDYPKNSHLEINFIASFDNLNLSDEDKTDWGRYNYGTYIVLRPEADVELFRSKLKNYMTTIYESSTVELLLQKVKDIHLYAKSGTGNITYIYIFTVIGILILSIAFINFINISTAKALERTKEIAIRKTHGATRKLLRQQIFSELSVLVGIALMSSVIIVILLIPSVNNISNKVFTIDSIFNVKLIISILGLIIFSVIISAFYPAVYLSSFDPVVIISNKNNVKKGSVLRKVLVTLQLTISVILIIGAFIIQRQLNYMRNKNLGYNKENIIYVHLSSKASDKFKAVGESIMQIGGVDAISFSHSLPVNMRRFNHIRRWDGHMNTKEDVMVYEMFIDQYFLPIYNLKLKSGRNFREDDNEFKLLINQQAADRMGLQNPVGIRIYNNDLVYEIIGVIEDFHFRPLTKEIEPMVLYYQPVDKVINIKLGSSNIISLAKEIEKNVKKILPRISI